jgi:hypothetical protein
MRGTDRRLLVTRGWCPRGRKGRPTIGRSECPVRIQVVQRVPTCTPKCIKIGHLGSVSTSWVPSVPQGEALADQVWNADISV